MTEIPPWETSPTMTLRREGINLFEQATRLDTLEQAWRRVHANHGCAGTDGVTVERFAERASQRLLGLCNRLRDGSYHPEPLRVFDVPKGNGEFRRLAIPSVPDRIAQGAAAQTLMPLLDREFEPNSFAYRPGRSVNQAVAAIRKYRDEGFVHVVEGDIERYFDQVPHDRLLDRLETTIRGFHGMNALLDLVALWLESAGVDLDTPGLGIPQGSPLSPLLSNLYLDCIDAHFADNMTGLRMIRFADDFVILCRREKRTREALAQMEKLLAEQGLRLNPDKTRIADFDRGFRFLGNLFVRSIVMPSKEDAGSGDRNESLQLLRWIAGEDAAADEREALEEKRREAGLDAGLRILYLHETGRVLATRQSLFTVETPQGELAGRREILAIPCDRIDRIEIGPAASVEEDALRLALLSGTLLHHVNGVGETIGVTASPSSDHGGLHLAQARIALDAELRLDLARRIVDARIRNQRATLNKLNRKVRSKTVIGACKDLGTLIRKLPIATDVPALLGYEGAAGATYWPSLALLVKPAFAVNERRFKRIRQPPPDPFNLVLNYLSWLLARDVGTIVRRHGLHPGFGALHSAADGQDACVYDLMEIYRASLVEGLAVYLFNNHKLDEVHFEIRESDGALRLAKDGHRSIIGGYEERMKQAMKSRRSGRNLRWRRLIEEDVVAYARHCRSNGIGDAAFSPWRVDY